MTQLISQLAIEKRKYWIEEIRKLSGNFVDDSTRLNNELVQEIDQQGPSALIDHLRLCGDIPESYNHDSSEEKLYSKYTDSLLCKAFNTMGLTSIIITARGDVADVEAVAANYALVADAKSFRLSRTAKNQKDFKIAALDGWKHGKDYAMVVCPIYQLPIKSSQIYQQASARDVCIFTYSHLSVLVSYSLDEGKEKTEELLYAIFKSVTSLIPSKDASSYWQIVNKTMLGFSNKIEPLWKIEKRVAVESIAIAKEEALTFLASEREKIMRMSHVEALTELVNAYKIDSKIRIISSVAGNNILSI